MLAGTAAVKDSDTKTSHAQKDTGDRRQEAGEREKVF
jgi:hypothetical protein